MGEGHEIYHPKNILVTGGLGFIGSHFVNSRLDGERIIIVDHCESGARNIKMVNEKLNTGIQPILIIADICDTDVIFYLLGTHEIDTVVHFAAQTSVDDSFKDSLRFTQDNVMGTHSLVEACHRYKKIKRFIHISTDEVYGSLETDMDGCKENGLLAPTNPYAATKASAEFIVKSYHKSYNFPVIITRSNNVYGTNQFNDKLIPKFILLLLDYESVPIHGKGSSLRSFIHVADVVSAIRCILSNGKVGEIYNIGSVNEYSVIEITDKLRTIICPEQDIDDIVEFVPDRPFNDVRYHINYEKLKKLGWKEEHSMDVELPKIVTWYRDHQSEYSRW